MTQAERFPDLEIYIFKVDADALQAWLESALGCQIFRLSAEHWLGSYHGQRVEIAVNPEVKKDFTSLWFKQNATPWATDLDCAKAANLALETEIRCSANGWDEDTDNADEEDIWFKVLRGQVKKFIWR